MMDNFNSHLKGCARSEMKPAAKMKCGLQTPGSFLGTGIALTVKQWFG